MRIAMQRVRWIGITCVFGCAVVLALPAHSTLSIGTAASQLAQDADARPDDVIRPGGLQELIEARPGVAVSYGIDGRIARLYGKPFGNGATPQAAADRFVNTYAGVWDLAPNDLAPIGPFPNGQHITPMIFDQDNGSYRFTGVHYSQQHEGVPVFRGRLTLLARNESDHPLVLASSDIRPVGDVDTSTAAQVIDEDVLRQRVLQRFHTECEITDAKYVIWAGVDDQFADSTLGVHYVAEYFGRAGHVKWLIIDDARTGAELYRENQILHADVTGNVSAMATPQGTGASVCAPAELTPLPYALVSHAEGSTYADAAGNYTLTDLDDGVLVAIESMIRGLYFRVVNIAGPDAVLSTDTTPPSTLDFLHDPATAAVPEQAAAEVDAYIQANLVRDFALSVNPSYPVIGSQLDFTINVNIDNNCNATYSGAAINFYTAGGGCNNTAFDSIVYHEYGHHLVNTGGSGQGQYGEGMSDCVALLITDDPILGRGFSSCGSGIRNANNSMQYPCFGGVHFCGTLLSGCVWSLRNQLISTEPDDWQDILSDLTINSILLHTGSMVTPQITIDFLTLDDDNADLFDGTPHYSEIMDAFLTQHNMDPDLPLLAFDFPQGIPEVVHPIAGSTIIVEVLADNGTPVPGTGMMHFDDGTGFVSMPMTQIAPNLYEAVLPAIACADGALLYFSADSTLPYTQQFPHEGPASPLRIRGATSVEQRFSDDFESDLGWTVINDEFLTDGAWDRGLPLGDGLRGDPPTDADGSGQCYSTDRFGGNTDVDGGTTTLVSPMLDASDSNVVSYWRWYNNAGGAAPQQDVFIVEISDDDGANWQLLEQVGPSGPEVFGGWIYKEFRLSELPGFEPNDQFRIRFIASDTDPQSLVEAAVDGMQLADVACGPTLPGDFTGDGTVDLEDLLLIISSWGSCSPAAPCVGDSDGDGVTGLNELLEVISNWGG